MPWPTLADYKVWAGIATSQTADDALLTGILTRAQALIESNPPMGTGRVFLGASSTRVADCPLAGNILYLWDVGDLITLTSVTNGDGTVIPATDYVTLPRRVGPYYGIELKANASTDWTFSDSPEGAISITGVWGYSTDVPEDIKQAFYRLTDWIYRSKDGETDRAIQTDAGLVLPSRLPKDINDILESYRSLV